MAVCTKCGKANREGIKFCSSCGNPMAAVSKPANLCQGCGKENRDGVKFCIDCGKPVGLSESPQIPPPVIPDIPITPMQDPVSAPPIPVIAAVPIPEPAPASHGPPLMQPERLSSPASPEPVVPVTNRKQLAMWIVAALLALVVIGLSWYVFRNWQAGRQTTAELIQPEAPLSEPQAAPEPEYDMQQSNQAIQPEPVEPAPAAMRPQRPAVAAQRPLPGSTRTQPANAPSFGDSSAVSSEEETRPMHETSPEPFSQLTQEERAPKYDGSSSGIMTWSGVLKKGAKVVITGPTASQGSLSSPLPGVPVIIEVEPRDVGIAETPAPSNGWTRMVLRANRDMQRAITIRWKVYR